MWVSCYSLALDLAAEDHRRSLGVDDLISFPQGHPAPDVLKRLDGDAVFRTDLNSDVAISTDGRRLWIETTR